MRTIRIAGLAVAACTALVMSACSSSSGGGGDTINGSSSSGAAPTATPILVGVVSPVTGASSVPVFQDGVKAGIAYINSMGGVNGHPIKAVYCDDQGQDPSKNAACIRSFVSAKVVTILNYGTAIATSLPISDAAGIAIVTSGATPPEQQSKTAIVPHSDAAGGFGALFAQAKKDGAKSAAGMVINVPQVLTLYGKVLSQAAAKAGLSYLRTVPVDPTASDYTPALLKASQGAEVITMSYGPGGMAQTVKDGQNVGVKATFGASNTLIDKNFLQPAGSAANGRVLAYSGVVPFTSDDPEVKTFRDQMEKAGYGDEIGGLPEIGYSYALTAYNALKKMTDYTAKAFSEYFQNNPVQVALGKVYDAKKTPFPDRPAVHVTAVQIVKVEGGDFVDAGGGWVDEYSS